MKICIIANGWTNYRSPYPYMNTALVMSGYYFPARIYRVSNMISIL